LPALIAAASSPLRCSVEMATRLGLTGEPGWQSPTAELITREHSAKNSDCLMILTMGYPSLRHQENAVKSGNAGCCGCWPDTQSRCALLGEDNGFAAKATPEDGGTRLERSPSVALTRAIWGPLSLRYG